MWSKCSTKLQHLMVKLYCILLVFIGSFHWPIRFNLKLIKFRFSIYNLAKSQTFLHLFYNSLHLRDEKGCFHSKSIQDLFSFLVVVVVVVFFDNKIRKTKHMN